MQDLSKMRTIGYSLGHEVLLLTAMAVVVVLIYSNTMGCPFIFDDVPNIKDNPHIRLTTLSLKGLAKAVQESPSSNRPVANISFALNYYVNGLTTPGYRIVNILIHIATGILLYLFIKTTLSTPVLRPRYGTPQWIPLFAVCIWLVHPIQTQSVTYIVQRMNSMAAMFYVLSLLLYARARLAAEERRKRVQMLGCILAGVLALGSKEIAATLPFFIFLYELFFFQDLRWTWIKRHTFLLAGLCIILLILALIMLQTDASQRKFLLYDTHSFTVTQRVLTEFRVIVYYISLIIWPHFSRLNLDYDFPLSQSLLAPPTTALSVGAVLALTGVAVYMAKKQRLLSFCILWFLGNLVIESSVIPLALIYEHRTYLPSMLAVLMAVILAFDYIRPKWLTVCVLCAIVGAQAVWTYQRNAVWGNELAFWQDCVEKSPQKARAHNNLGSALKKRGRTQEAMYHFSEALRIKPDYAKAHNNLANALKDQGEVDQAITQYLKALHINPEYVDALYNLANAFKKQGKLEHAVANYVKALRINPHYAKAHINLGNVLTLQGKIDEAIAHFSQALRINPDLSLAHNNLGNALLRKGDLREAMHHYMQALRIRPNNAKTHYNIGVALARQGRITEAAGHYSQALRIKPDFHQAQRNLKKCLEVMGKSTGAIP